MTRVLLTGAGGFLGQHILQHLLMNTDWDITTVSRSFKVPDSPAICRYCERITPVTCDLVKRAPELAEFPDYIIANASRILVPESIADPAGYMMDNTAIILNTLELARKVKPAAVLVVSTNMVYGAGSHSEWDPVIPGNPYSASKAAQEAAAIAYWRTYNVPVIIVNPMNPFGERQPADRFIPKVIHAVSRGEEIPIHAGSRNWIHARNLADAILFLLNAELEWSGDCPPRFNIAGYEETLNLDLAQMIAGYAGMPLKYRPEEEPDRPGHESRYSVNTGKITSLGWKLPVSFAESLQRTVRWTLDQGGT